MTWSSLIPSFLASIVEFVEALTIVLVVGVTINWKSSLWGALTAFITLSVLVGIFGTTIVVFIPISILRLVIGIILVLFGLQWLKKSVLRYTGLKAIHDEALIYEKNKNKLESFNEIDPNSFSKLGFLTSFKSVLLEGLEVAFIVITFGTTSGNSKFEGIFAAAIGAMLAFLVVVTLGFIVRSPLTKIPENTLKFIVGIMLVTFGTFWGGEGLGINWPLSDLFLFILIIFYLGLCGAIILWLRNKIADEKEHYIKTKDSFKNYKILRVMWEVFDFFCGDWTVFWGITFTLILTILIHNFKLLSFANPLIGIVYLIGISSSFAVALNKQQV